MGDRERQGETGLTVVVMVVVVSQRKQKRRGTEAKFTWIYIDF